MYAEPIYLQAEQSPMDQLIGTPPSCFFCPGTLIALHSVVIPGGRLIFYIADVDAIWAYLREKGFHPLAERLNLPNQRVPRARRSAFIGKGLGSNLALRNIEQ